MTTISGQIHFPEGTPAFSGATAHLVLEDTSMADAPAPVIAEYNLTDVNYESGATIGFTFKSITLNEQVRYNIRVHISLNDNNTIQQGDYITMQSYPVLTEGFPNTVNIEVRRVG